MTPQTYPWLAGRPRRLAVMARDELLLRQRLAAERQDLHGALSGAPTVQRNEMSFRLAQLARTLGAAPGSGETSRIDAVEQVMSGAGPAEVWLALAVLTAEFPLAEDVVETLRRLRIDGPSAALGPCVARATSLLSPDRRRPPNVEVVTGAVLLDLHHTSQTELATGIQRVAREVAQRWVRDHSVVLVGWTTGYRALRRLDPRSARRAVGEPVVGPDTASARERETIVVPWRCTYVLVELATEEPRTRRIQSFARFSGNRTGFVGHDCVPLTSAETAADSMGGAFAGLLAAVRHADRVATVSQASAVEYRGWRAMLAGTGLSGPRIDPIPLAISAREPCHAALEEAQHRFLVGRMPMVLVVGSHEPRKNHLAVLHVAELLWREGNHFSLLMVGGNAWHSERFEELLRQLRAAGRPVESVQGLSDDLLWACYRLARVMLFPSLSEGFGLPVAEALAAGTPVITTRHGSTAEIASGGGALLVDPRDDRDIAAALRRVLTEDQLLQDLRESAVQVQVRTWDDYAAELWDFLVAW